MMMAMMMTTMTMITMLKTMITIHSGHHDSPVRGVVICYTRSFHLLNLLFLLVAASHSGHQDSLVRGIVICYTKTVGAPHGERVVCPPVETGRASC